jgi:hypothetical protein
MKREKQKYFGEAAFDYVIHHSELDRMVGHLCFTLGEKTIYNFKYFNYALFKHNRGYRRQVKYFVKLFPRYDRVVTNKESEQLNITAGNLTLNEDGTFPVDTILKEMQ